MTRARVKTQRQPRGAALTLALWCAFAGVVGPAAGPAAAEDDAGRPRRISGAKAFMLSLLLPGLGQRANGDHTKAALFMGAEATIWTTAGAFHLVGEMREDDYREYAELQAGADASQDSEDYYQLVADYSSNHIYNIGIADEARFFYESRSDQLQYIAENSITDGRDWQWADFASRRKYQLLRHDARSAKRTAVLATGWAVANRVISAVEAARTARNNQRLDKAESTEPEGLQVSVGLVRAGGETAPGILVGHRF